MNTQNKNSPTDKTSKKYTFAQREGDDFTCIKLLEGKFKNVIYHYGNVAFAPESEKKPDGTLPFRFDYTVVRNPENADTLDNQEFIDYIGDILLEILEEQIKNGTAIQNWTNNTI